MLLFHIPPDLDSYFLMRCTYFCKALLQECRVIVGCADAVVLWRSAQFFSYDRGNSFNIEITHDREDHTVSVAL